MTSDRLAVHCQSSIVSRDMLKATDVKNDIWIIGAILSWFNWKSHIIGKKVGHVILDIIMCTFFQKKSLQNLGVYYV